MIKKLTPGDSQIPASGWNEMRQFINEYEAQQHNNKTEKRNPFLITVKNTTGGALDPLSVVKIANPTYSRTGDSFANKGIEFGTELNGSTPDSEENNIAIIQGACPANGFIKAIADGCTPAFVYCDDNSHYEYAKPVDDITSYLKATNDPTNIRILWHATGMGKKEAYVCLDATGEGDPLRVAATMPNTDERPEGAFKLDTTDTWLYADAIDSFAKEDDSNPLAIVNPCGYPIDRPVIIGKCIGFQGIQEDESENSSSSSSSSSENPAPEAVAIACDVREFFVINNGSDTNSSSSSSSSSGSFDPNYLYGSLEYIEYDASDYRWKPATGSDAYKHRLAVCQRDLPANWTKEYRMPYYTPEQNYGAEPKRATSSGSSSSTSFVEHCGCYPGEHEFSNKRLDYHYANGRYSYEPRFVYIGEAKGGSGTGGVAITIEGNDYDVDFPSPRSATSYPDIYAYDKITVEVDARGAEPILTAIDYPMDFPEDTIIMTHSGKPGRGWEDVTSTINGDDLGTSNDILVLKKNNNPIIAAWVNHQCTCSSSTPTSGSGTTSSGSGGGGHMCPHDQILVAETTAKWYKKVKTGALK